ncbi:TPA: hypothetical protein JD772_002975 [Legionella pneumophila]|nr:hypothetical protein [Legionella pneumophila]
MFRYEIYEKNRFRFHSFNDALYNFLDELIGFGKPPTDILAIQSTQFTGDISSKFLSVGTLDDATRSFTVIVCRYGLLCAKGLWS